MAVLEVNDLRMYFALEGKGCVKAVDGLAFSLERGRTLGIVGESGCGKSSLATTLLQVLPDNGRVTSGSILLDGVDVLQLGEEVLEKSYRWKKIAMVFQGAMNSFDPVFKVGDQLVEAIVKHSDLTEKEARMRMVELLESVRIERSVANYYPHEYSGGMKQRAMIAMALALNPEVLIADEPTTALDVIAQAQILKLMRQLQSERNISMILITHDVAIVSEMSDDIAVMYAGKIVEHGSTEGVILSPGHPYTKGLLESVPVIQRGRRKKLESITGTPPNLLDPPRGCRFHPRCPYRIPVCDETEPELAEFDGSHVVACHRMLEKLW